jgi:hypothetical protein
MVFGRRHMVEENRRSYLIPLPVCELHGQYDGALNDVALFPHRGRSVVVHPVCNDFILALRAHRQAQANAFNSALANNQPSDAKDFLKSLEQE